MRQTTRRTARNKARMSLVRAEVKKVVVAAEAGDKKAGKTALAAAAPQLQRAARKGLIHKRTAARKISRLAKRLNKVK